MQNQTDTNIRPKLSSYVISAVKPNQRNIAYLTVTAAFVIMFAFAQVAGLNVDYVSLVGYYLFAAGLGFVALFVMTRDIDMIRNVAEVLLLNAFLFTPILVISYAAMTASGGAALQLSPGGLDPTLVWTNDPSSLMKLQNWAYKLFDLQMILLAPLMVYLGHRARAYRSFGILFLAGLAAAAVATLLPGYCEFTARWPSYTNLMAMNAAAVCEFGQSTLGAPVGADAALSAANTGKLVAFPTLFGALAALGAWLSWPSIVLRRIVVPFNAVMVVCALSLGISYALGVMAGAGTALIIIAVASHGLRGAIAAAIAYVSGLTGGSRSVTQS